MRNWRRLQVHLRQVERLALEHVHDIQGKITDLKKLSSSTAGSATTIPDGPIVIGSEVHKRLMCSVMIDLHDPYKASEIAWPALDDEALTRIRALPFWNDAITTEDGATRDLRVLAAAEPDPLVREAVALQAFEENRRGEVIAAMCRFYGIDARVESGHRAARDPEWAYLRMGYGECFDSFFAFGLFALAERSGFFPPRPGACVRACDPGGGAPYRILRKWAAWSRANRPAWRRPLHRLRCLRALGVQAWRRLKGAWGAASADDFTSRSARSFADGLNARSFFELCLAENERRVARYDARLLRPKAMPATMRFATRLMRRPAAGTGG